MRSSRALVQRLLDPNDLSVTLATMNKAAAALGLSLRLERCA